MIREVRSLVLWKDELENRQKVNTNGKIWHFHTFKIPMPRTESNFLTSPDLV